jgi:PAS domain S-box-containing protein
MRREAGEALQRSERFHRLIADLTSDFTFSVRRNEGGASSSVDFVSPGFTAITGYTLEELNARGGWPTIVHPDDRAVTARTVERMIAGQKDQAEVRLLARDGAVRWVRYLCHPVMGAEGRMTGFVGAVQHVTDRKQAEEAPREANATLRSFYDTAPVMTGVVEVGDEDVLHLTDNASPGRFFGVHQQQLARHRATELGVPKDHVREWVRHYRESERTGQAVRFEYPHQTADGTRWVSAIVYCIERLPGGRCRCSYMAEDVTEKM